MDLFEIHQRFRGHFLNELRVSFKEKLTFTSSTLFTNDNMFILGLGLRSEMSF